MDADKGPGGKAMGGEVYGKGDDMEEIRLRVKGTAPGLGVVSRKNERYGIA